MADPFWHEEGQAPFGLMEELEALQTIYRVDGSPSPLCYPGTVLNPAIGVLAGRLICRQHNLIGTHTRHEVGEGGFEAVQGKEREVIGLLAHALGGSLATVDGHFCGGGTEANLEALWIGCEALTAEASLQREEVIVFTTPLVHYSVLKACRILHLSDYRYERCQTCGTDHRFVSSNGRLRMIGMDENGEMRADLLADAWQQAYGEGYRRFLFVLTAGTTGLGSVDPIAEVGAWIQNVRATHTDVACFLHVDASFGGFTIPFVDRTDRPAIGFDVEAVDSVTLDADKMGRLPYPAGIILVRKGLQKYIERPVSYVNGHTDDTVPGSRSALPALLGWFLYKSGGKRQQREYVSDALFLRDRLYEMLRPLMDAGKIEIITRHPCVNFLPMSLMEDTPQERDRIESLLSAYHLRSDLLPRDPSDPTSCVRHVYKLCLMPHHTIGTLVRFVADLTRALEATIDAQEAVK